MNTSELRIGDPDVIDHVTQWLDQFVIRLDLCPFAKRERLRDTVRFVVTRASSPQRLLRELLDEIDYLTLHPEIETTLLIHPDALTTFHETADSPTTGEHVDYNQFLNLVDDAIDACGHGGVYQVASFHPQYQFAGTGPEDAQNYTNRSPYPMLHILREASIARALRQHAGPDSIPARNIDVLNRLGVEAIKKIIPRQP